MDRRYFQWQAQAGMPDIEAAIERGDAVEISLPQSAHHALYMHVTPHARSSEGARLDASGGPELLDAMARVAGLQDVALLVEPVRRAGYAVVLQSPDPTLVLLPSGQQPLRVSSAVAMPHASAAPRWSPTAGASSSITTARAAAFTVRSQS